MPHVYLDTLLGARFFNQFIGSDPFFKSMESVVENSSNANYPPHDIINQRDGVYAIMLAVAGIDKADLEVVLKGQTLSISGNVENKTEHSNYAHRGIAKRNFRKIFALGRNVEVENVIFKNGLLTVHIKEVVPESQQAKQLTIN